MERLSADTFRLVLDTMIEGVVLHDASGDVVWCNPSAARILGPSVMLSLRTSGAQARPASPVGEDGSELEWDDHPAMAVLRTGRPQRDVVMGIEQPDGTRLWVSANAEPIHSPRPGGASAVVV